MDPQQNYARAPMQGQHQTQIPQWQCQSQPGQYQQEVPGGHQGMPPQPHMEFQYPSTAMPPPTQGTPQLDEMYSQIPMQAQQGHQPYDQQDHQPHQGFQIDQASQAQAQAQQYQGTPPDPEMYAPQQTPQAPLNPTEFSYPQMQQQQQDFIPHPAMSQHSMSQMQEYAGPRQPFFHQPAPQAATQAAHQDYAGQGSQFGYHPNASAWEQQNVTEVNDSAPAAAASHHPQAGQFAQQDPSTRAAELGAARQRIFAAELEREELDTQRALALSAQENVELRKQDEQQMHQALLSSLDSYEQDLRRHLAGGSRTPTAGPAASAYDAASQYGYGEPYLSNLSNPAGQFSDPGSSRASGMGMGMGMEGPALHPSATTSLPSGVENHHPTPSQAARSQQTPSIHPYSVSSPPESSQQQYQQQAGGSGGFTPRSYTPTPGTPASSAARNLGAEEARR